MLQIQTSLNLGSRIDLTASAWVLASGAQGTFVAFGGSDDVKKPSAGDFALPIWTESNRDGSAGFTPDVTATGKVTVFYGKLKGITDQFVGTPAVGAPLYVDANGKLTTTSAGNAVVIASCTKAAHNVTYLGKAYSCIEFVLI